MFPNQKEIERIQEERFENNIKKVVQTIANGKKTFFAQMDLKSVKKKFSAKETTQSKIIDEYVEDTLSHAKDLIKKTNIMRTSAVIGLKKSLILNVDEELHREEQKQAVRELIKSRDVFGIGFEEF